MSHTYLVPTREGEQPDLQLIAIVADSGEIIPVAGGPGMKIVITGAESEREHTATSLTTGSTGGQA